MYVYVEYEVRGGREQNCMKVSVTWVGDKGSGTGGGTPWSPSNSTLCYINGLRFSFSAAASGVLLNLDPYILYLLRRSVSVLPTNLVTFALLPASLKRDHHLLLLLVRWVACIQKGRVYLNLPGLTSVLLLHG